MLPADFSGSIHIYRLALVGKDIIMEENAFFTYIR